MDDLPAPPIVPAKRSLTLGGRAVPVTELRARFPVLQPFVAETSFEDGDTVFPTQDEACRYVFRHAIGSLAAEIEALNADIARFNSEFPEGSPDRIAAFHALGSVIGRADYVTLRLTPVDLNLVRFPKEDEARD
jgi:hypothetical protein